MGGAQYRLAKGLNESMNGWMDGLFYIFAGGKNKDILLISCGVVSSTDQTSEIY